MQPVPQEQHLDINQGPKSTKAATYKHATSLSRDRHLTARDAQQHSSTSEPKHTVVWRASHGSPREAPGRVERTVERHDRLQVKKVKKQARAEVRTRGTMTDDSRSSKHSMIDASPNEQPAKRMRSSGEEILAAQHLRVILTGSSMNVGGPPATGPVVTHPTSHGARRRRARQQGRENGQQRGDDVRRRHSRNTT